MEENEWKGDVEQWEGKTSQCGQGWAKQTGGKHENNMGKRFQAQGECVQRPCGRSMQGMLEDL